MSYTIEYDKIFLKSGAGYTPLWLAGDSNCYEGSGRNQRRVRDWSVFMSQLGVTEEKLMERIQPLLGGPYQEHWQRLRQMGGRQGPGYLDQEWLQECRVHRAANRGQPVRRHQVLCDGELHENGVFSLTSTPLTSWTTGSKPPRRRLPLARIFTRGSPSTMASRSASVQS